MTFIESIPPQFRRPHGRQDLQSVLFHREAVRLMQEDSSLVAQAMSTLRRWRSEGDRSTDVLWARWEEILRERDWEAAVAEDEASISLRKASPMATVLPQETRLAIMTRLHELYDASE